MNHLRFFIEPEENFYCFIVDNPNEKNDIPNRYDLYYSDKLKNKTLYLLNSRYTSFIFNAMPKHFTITTNSHDSYKFNIELLGSTSKLISNLLKQSPEILQYHLNIDDKNDTFKKIDKIYKGKKVYFDESEISTVNSIISILGIDNFTHKLNQRFFDPELSFGIDYQKFFLFLKNEDNLRSFKIITNKKEYQCNIFGIYSSKILLDIITNNPTIKEYKYDFDDDFDEFQQISNLFNFYEVTITKSNMYSLKEIMNDLQITIFDEKINKYIECSEKVSQTIDDEQSIIDSNEELFMWLYGIKENSVYNIKNLIINSDWIKTEQKIQEFVAFILQVVQTDYSYQPYIIDLLIQLDKESDSIYSLKMMFPFLIEKVTVLLGENLTICSFVYNLYKNRIILKEKLIMILQKVFKTEIKDYKKHKPLENWSPYYFNRYFPKTYNLVLWFYPEISEEIEKQLKININDITPGSLRKYFPGNESGYLKMRDDGEPDDEITKLLKYDDIDTFQKLIIKNGLNTQSDNSKMMRNIANELIPFNLFDDFILKKRCTYIDYACSFGSIKCFKYLLLNHATVDSNTFQMAIFGGNIEIIRILNQIIQEKDPEDDSITITIFNELIYPSIIKHNNDVFDWIFQEKYLNHKIDNDIMNKLLLHAAKNGNAHALIEFIENGYDFINNASKIFVEISKNGYYLLTKLFFVILGKVMEKNIYIDYSYSAYFGNISIFKLSYENIKHGYELCDALQTAIKCKQIKIIQYFFQNLINDNFTSNTVFTCLKTSISKKNNEMFNYFVQQFLNKNPSIFYSFSKFDQLLSIACSKNNMDIFKILIDMIIKYRHEEDDFSASFTNAIILGNIEMCNYFVKMKFYVDYENLSNQVSIISDIKLEAFDLIVKNAIQEAKEMFLNKIFLEKAITNNNKSFVEYLLKSNVVSDKSLFLAVSQNNSDLVDIILKYNTSFINKISNDGTVLCMAAANNNLKIVKSLLSVQGINPSLYDQNHKTPLILAVEKINFEISNEILNFYGEDNQTESNQFNKSLKILLKYLFKEENEKLHNFYINMEKENDYSKNPDVIKILKRILKFKAIDVNYMYKNSTILIYACMNNEIDIFNILLHNKKTDFNLYSPINGNSPLMISILEKNYEIAKMLIEHPGVNINLCNFEGETPLTISVKKNLENIVDLLINNEKFDPEESCINEAFFYSSGNISNLLCSVKSLDVNYHSDKYEYIADEIYKKHIYENRIFKTTLINSIENNDIDKIDLIINHHSFNQAKSQFIKAIFTSVKLGYFEIYKKLIKLINNDVNIYDSCKNYLFNYAIKGKNEEIVIDILANPKLDLEKCDILAAFASYVKNNTDRSVNMMNKILDFDKDHFKKIDFSKLLPSGESFFTLIASQQFIDKRFISIVIDSSHTAEIASFLIDHGVDPNIPDKNGFYPLEYAIMLDSIEFVRVLINSKKIDFSQIVETKSNLIRICDQQLEGSLKPSNAKKKTYLHIAARSKNTEILKELVEKNVIDINSTDELGETPLFEACRFNRLGNIEYLASLNNIDYNHCNNEGDDVLQMSSNLLDKFPENEITNRNDYFMALFSIFVNDEISFLNLDHLE